MPCLLLVLAGFILHGRPSPHELVIESTQTQPVSPAEARAGYDTKIVVTARLNGPVPQYPSLRYVGDSLKVWNRRLVRKIGATEKPLSWHDPSAVQIAFGSETKISFRLNLARIPLGGGDVVLKVDLKRDYFYNVYRGGKAIRLVHYPSPGVPVVLTVRHEAQPSKMS